MHYFAFALMLAMGATATAQAQQPPPWSIPKTDFGGAKALNEGKWFSFSDFPDEAVRMGKQGFVVVDFEIGANGRITQCSVAKSSGHQVLDKVPCRLLTKRAKFAPAKDVNETAVATRGTTTMLFWMPN